MKSMLDELQAVLGSSGIIRDDAVRERPADWLGFAKSSALAWIRPANTQEVSAALRICHKYGRPVVPAGGLTGLVRGTDADPATVILSLERMSGIESIDPVGRTAVVLAGTPLETVQTEMAAKGLKFALDLGARGSCTIGGNIATNAGGTEVLRYGMMRDQVLGLEVVLANGEIISSMNQLLKNNTGYDLKQLFIGSEGTLGIVTRAVLRLHPAPESRNTALVAANSFDAVETLFSNLSQKLAGSLSGFEVMWDSYYRLAVADSGAPIAPGHAFYILVESEGSDHDRDAAVFMGALEAVSEVGLVTDAVVANSGSQRDAIWAIRENVAAVAGQLGPLYVFDVSLPIREMPDYLDVVEGGLREAFGGKARLVVFGHIGDGNLHLFVGAEADAHETVQSCVYRPLEKRHGSVSAEHGIGLEKRAWLPLSRNPVEIALMARLKRALDPTNILNPGKILESTDLAASASDSSDLLSEPSANA
ncbi:MAG: oxidoreductase [Hyphobacterium sp.]|nr:MAG: oxidoreductase [Hyphobacterium sp.]